MLHAPELIRRLRVGAGPSHEIAGGTVAAGYLFRAHVENAALRGFGHRGNPPALRIEQRGPGRGGYVARLCSWGLVAPQAAI